MNDISLVVRYSALEERINILSHFAGLLLSVVALFFLVQRANQFGSPALLISFSIFGISMIALYAASTLYHSAKNPVRRLRLRTVDHAAIYVLIAGTYTPFCLVTLQGRTGWLIFAMVWSMALTGIVLKLFFTGRYKLLSTTMYVCMGWSILFAVKPLLNNLSGAGTSWLLAGGIAYTLGAIVYSMKFIKLNHAIFHVFVLAGSVCHFFAVFLHVLPGS